MKTLSLFEGNRAAIMSIFYGILNRIALENTGQSRLIPAIRFIENNFHRPSLTNGELARECNISEIYFRRLFTEIYKTTPKQYLIEIRINKAKQLLTDGALKVGCGRRTVRIYQSISFLPYIQGENRTYAYRVCKA